MNHDIIKFKSSEKVRFGYGGDSAMRKISIIILSVILLSSCAMLNSLRPPDANTIEYARLGIKTDTINGEIVVRDFNKWSPAKSAGVKAGDILVSLDGEAIKTRKAIKDLVYNKQKGERVLLIINRNGKQITFDIEPVMKKLLPTAEKIENLLLENNKVSVAIIVSSVKTSFRNPPEGWADSMRNDVQALYEHGLLRSTDPYLSVVDRSKLKQITDELQFSQSGFISDELRAKVGKITGATHVIDISLYRFQSGLGKDDLLNARLIKIETGEVLAIDHVTMHH